MAYYPINRDHPLLVCSPAYPFEFHSCEYTTQAARLTR